MLDENTPLYRYISFERFNQMLFTKEFALVSPKRWPDKFELYWLKLLETLDGKEQLKAYVKRFKGDNKENAEKILKLCSYQYDHAFCLCFSLIKDAEVLWNTRSDNHKCIMLSTTVGKVCKLLRDEHNYTIEKIKYDLEGTKVEDFFSKYRVYPEGASSFDTDDLFLHKRECFSYEKEARLILYPDPERNATDTVLKYPIPSLCDYIDDVMVHPSASAEYVALISSLCDQFTVPFGGKSSIYTFQPIHSN